MSRIATLCMNPSVDRSGRAGRIEPGHKTRCRDERREPGGGGINVARGIAALGGSVLAVYPAGGTAGERLERMLEAQGIAQRVIPVEGETRENLAVQETSTGRNYHFVFPGARLSAQELRRCEDAVLGLDPAPDYLVMSGSLPPGAPDDFYAALARRCAERGIRAVVDTSGEPLRAVLAAKAFLVKPNRRELAEIYDLRPESPEGYFPRLESLVDAGHAEAMVVTVGREGALLATAGRRLHVAPPPIEGESPVGAGDSFLAAMIHHLAGGASLEQALAWGVAGAAAAVKTPGTELYRPPDLERIHGELSTPEDARRR